MTLKSGILFLFGLAALSAAKAEAVAAAALKSESVAATTTTAPAAAPAPVAVPSAPQSEPLVKPAVLGHKAVVYVIPVHDEIAKPTLYILRRGFKEAIDQKADAVVLDMKTPGGEMGVTLEIMEAMQDHQFHGQIIAYVDKEAMSAGAFISAAAEEIYFAPGSVIGAAAPVTSTGSDIDATMKEKLVSYMKGKVRAVSEGKGYRGQVVSAMIDADYELKIGDTVIKAKGGLLTLTATEAMKTYGEPPQPLLGSGVAADVDALLTKKFGPDNFIVRDFEITWSEKLAQYLTALSPILMGLGLLGLFLEFKMPMHGWFAGGGVVLLALVFFGQYAAGLSGHEPILLFTLGLLLLVVEVFFFPGTALPALAGLGCMLVALVWSMADIWPREPISFSGDMFVRPLTNLSLGLVLAVVLGIVLLRYLPKGWMWDRLVVGAVVGTSAQTAGGAPGSAAALDDLVGVTAVAATALRPGGQIEIAGKRYEARAQLGAIANGSRVVVRGRDDFALIVEEEGA